MEQYKVNKEIRDDVVRIPEVLVDGQLEENADHLNASTDKVNHTVEQSSANLFPKSDDLSTKSDDQPASLPTVNDSTAINETTPTAIRIPISDKFLPISKESIEKAWVIKAKAIIASTQNDPFLKSNEITKIKTDYKKQPRFKNLISS
jgi:hypothetical protein